MTPFIAEPVLRQLKDFQRRTVDHVFSRFYEDQPPATRFLVADEVGLGKTLVARGVIAKAVERLQHDVERVDIVYVCSNAQIARQNVRRLRVSEHEHFEVADRLTMLPATAHHLAANQVNLISFTPGTSFDLKGGDGRVGERAMLRLILRVVWGESRFKGRGSMRVFQGGVQKLETFERHYRGYGAQPPGFARTNPGRFFPTDPAGPRPEGRQPGRAIARGALRGALRDLPQGSPQDEVDQRGASGPEWLHRRSSRPVGQGLP